MFHVSSSKAVRMNALTSYGSPDLVFASGASLRLRHLLSVKYEGASTDRRVNRGVHRSTA